MGFEKFGRIVLIQKAGIFVLPYIAAIPFILLLAKVTGFDLFASSYAAIFGGLALAGLSAIFEPLIKWCFRPFIED